MIFLIKQDDITSTVYEVDAKSLSEAKLKLNVDPNLKVVDKSTHTHYAYKIKEEK